MSKSMRHERDMSMSVSTSMSTLYNSQLLVKFYRTKSTPLVDPISNSIKLTEIQEHENATV